MNAQLVITNGITLNDTWGGELGLELSRFNIISVAQTIADIKADKKVLDLLRNSMGRNLSSNWKTSNYGGPWEISDHDIFYYCSNSKDLDNYLLINNPFMCFMQRIQFDKITKKLFRKITSSINSLIESFPTHDGLDYRFPPEREIKRRKLN